MWIRNAQTAGEYLRQSVSVGYIAMTKNALRPATGGRTEEKPRPSQTGGASSAIKSILPKALYKRPAGASGARQKIVV